MDALLEEEDDVQGEAGPSNGPSQQELRWLARYLKARIEAIKSESDDEEAEAEPSHPPHQQQQQANARTMGHAAQPMSAQRYDDEPPAQSPTSTAPTTPANHRSSHRQLSTDDRPMAPSTPAPPPTAMPTSNFSFALNSSLPFSAADSAMSTGSSSRRRPRGTPSRAAHHSSSLSPVGEDGRASSMEDDANGEDVREERGHGRRGPLPASGGTRPKRRRRIVDKTIPAGAMLQTRQRGGGSGNGDDEAGAG